jgi:thiol-disulfide isomerase/thioredoxin
VTFTPTVAGATTYPGPGGGNTATATGVFVATPSPTPTSVLVQTPTGTLPAPVLPTFAPTPTPMPTPTAAPTPIPPPPWVSANLQATDPDSVELASGRVQLIWFFAFWDGPSQAMAPLVHGLEEQYGERMNFIYLDIDDPDTATFKDALGYRAQPHFFLLDVYGNVLQQWQGYVSVAEFQQAFEAALPQG